jgi:hypothetical protein
MARALKPLEERIRNKISKVKEIKIITEFFWINFINFNKHDIINYSIQHQINSEYKFKILVILKQSVDFINQKKRINSYQFIIIQ